jgi:hypothetical protein
VANRSNFNEFNIDEADAAKFIQLAVKSELEFEVMNNRTSQYQILNPGQLQKIYSNHPKREDICLIEGHYASEERYISGFSYDQPINYQDLWFDGSKFEAILSNIKDKASQNDSTSNEVIKLETSSYWQQLKRLAKQAIINYPTWKATQGKVQKTGNLQNWLSSTLKTNSRETEIIKKILSDFYTELN